jgi:hypothetical protein
MFNFKFSKLYQILFIIFLVSCAKGSTNSLLCGNGIIDSEEECDDSGESATCNSNCTTSVCGDGILNPTAGEVCDEGGETESCTVFCVLHGCGNGEVEVNEECDDSGESATCNANCTNSVCGDGVLNTTAGEACDDGAETENCTSSCTVPGCGDGVVDSNEQCDDSGESATCNTNCTNSACGDGILNTTAGEACDDGGESITCNTDCTDSSCGDGILNTTSGEECDGTGETSTCNTDCTNSTCGDGILNTTAGEECDGAGETSSCDPDCTDSVCGDGYHNSTAGEECDDGDSDDFNTCSNSCNLTIACDAPMTTTMEAGNGWSGNMFDIVALNSITITKLDGHFWVGSQDITIYYRTGSYVGNDSSSVGWNLLGSTTVAGAGAGVVTEIPITFSITVSAGQRIAFFIASTNNGYSAGNYYTNGSGAGTLHSSNADLQFYEGIGTGTTFGENLFSDRIFNGVIHYNCD